MTRVLVSHFAAARCFFIPAMSRSSANLSVSEPEFDSSAIACRARSSRVYSRFRQVSGAAYEDDLADDIGCTSLEVHVSVVHCPN